MTLAQQQKLEDNFVMHTYGRKPVQFVRGSGMHLYDDTGKEYLDFLAGIGTMALGHANAAVISAINEQAAKLMHVGNYFYIEKRGELAQKLSSLLAGTDPTDDGKRWGTFFANSGAEANEGAIKIARKYGRKHLNGADTIVTARRSFHGRTLATLAATGQASKQECFLPMPPGFLHVDLNDIDALKLALHQGVGGKHVCAVLLECIQGEGGVYPANSEYLKAVRKMTQETGALLILDEVQTGIYRTGAPFAFMHHDIVPDVVTMAKALGNGIPIGAVAARGAALGILEPGDHGSTFGGSAIAVAAASATLDELAAFEPPGIAVHVAQVGQYFTERLGVLDKVQEIRGQGLMIGVEFSDPIAESICNKALDKGFVFCSIGHHIVRFLPPLICTKSDVDKLIDCLIECQKLVR